jgi:maltooligosyltrehalose trehalohydrolase
LVLKKCPVDYSCRGGQMPSNKVGGGRKYPAGAELVGKAISFRVWAPEHRSIALVLDRGLVPLNREDSGYFSCWVEGLAAGTRYGFRLDDNNRIEADPASRWQPDGPDGKSAIVDPYSFQWTDAAWEGVTREGQVLYEMHVGTFTTEGTWAAALRQLPRLVDIGVTVIEMMPVNEFFGSFGWGYDGVLLYAPTHLYGSPDDLRAFVNEAHRLGIGVIVDVVYNHFGPGDRFEAFSPSYFTDRYENEWGRSLNFDAPGCEGARDYVVANAAYWIDEFHFDGLRIDATQALIDVSDRHIIAEIAAACRQAAGDRNIYLVAENEPQLTELVRSTSVRGLGLDAVWNDDFHHSAMVAATGRNEAYYHDHKGLPQEFVSAAKYGYLFQGQRYDWQDKTRGTPGLDLVPVNFVHFLQNHDQIANSALGLRLSDRVSPARLRALTALLLLGPQTPLLFQGQEFGSSSRFLYFFDSLDDIAERVEQGRQNFLKQFPGLCDPAALDRLAKPHHYRTFASCKLDWSEFDKNRNAVRLHRDLVGLRRGEPAIQRAGSEGALDASVIGPAAMLIRYFGRDTPDDRLLVINLGVDLPIDSIPDPLFAPPAGFEWRLAWSSDDPNYGGGGQRPLDPKMRWVLSGDTALFFQTSPAVAMTELDRAELNKWQKDISGIG